MFDNSDRSFLLQVLATTSGDSGRHSTRVDAAADESRENDTAGLRRAVIAALTKEVSRIAEHVKNQE
jgi:hypothetical protein